jgi:hypothetical protein
MKNFVSPSFFRLFDLLMSTYNPGLKRAHWTLDGVDCWRERHSYTGRLNGFVVETFTFTRAGRRGWTLMVVKEYWWIGEETKALKTLRWARPISGRRSDAIAWFRDQEAVLDRSAPPIAHIGKSQ